MRNKVQMTKERVAVVECKPIGLKVRSGKETKPNRLVRPNCRGVGARDGVPKAKVTTMVQRAVCSQGGMPTITDERLSNWATCLILHKKWHCQYINILIHYIQNQYMHINMMIVIVLPWSKNYSVLSSSLY